MKTVAEKIDKENFIEMAISEKEMEFLKEFMILSTTCYIEGILTNVGIRLEINPEEDLHGNF